jgi:hypothetical protein
LWSGILSDFLGEIPSSNQASRGYSLTESKREARVGMTERRRMNGKQASFVSAYLAGASGADAARAAGYADSNAKFTACRLLKRVPAVREAIDAGQRQVMATGQMTAEKMAVRAAEAAQFAREKGNAMAMCKCLELEAKLYGLLIDRVDQRSVGNLTVEVVRFSGND